MGEFLKIDALMQAMVKMKKYKGGFKYDYLISD
jgi:hypothetical protein